MRHLLIYLAAMMALLCSASGAYANPLGSTLCNVIDWFVNGKVGVGLASISIFITAIAAAMQKISWGMFIFASLDVVLIFGAGWFALEFGGVDCYTP